MKSFCFFVLVSCLLAILLVPGTDGYTGNRYKPAIKRNPFAATKRPHVIGKNQEEKPRRRGQNMMGGEPGFSISDF